MSPINLLKLQHNRLGDRFASELAEGLRAGAKGTAARSLRRLLLQHNRITDDGAESLADAIANNKRTKLFDIRLGFQNINEPMGPRVTREGKYAIQAAGETLGRKVECVLAPLAPEDNFNDKFGGTSYNPGA